jgi:K+-sensing histidine kinase KdpD
LALPEGGEPLNIWGRVVWTEPVPLSRSHQIGLRFFEFVKPQHFQRLLMGLEKAHNREESYIKLPLRSRETFASMTPIEVDRIAFLANLSRHLNRSHEVGEVAEIAVESIAGIMRAEKVMLMMDRGGTAPEVLACRGLVEEGPTYPYSRSVVKRVLAEGKAILSFDVANDQSLNHNSSLDFLGTRSILCTPLVGRGVVFGLIYMDNNMEKAAFSEGDQEVAVILSELTASALERGQYFSKLVQVEKMNTLGTLTASLAHELNNPLTVVSGISELLKEEPVDASLISDLTVAVERCKELVRDITNWSRTEKTPPGEIEVGQVLEATWPMVKSEVQNCGVRLALEVAEELPRIKGQVCQLSQVLVNLINNSLHVLAGRPDGAITIQATSNESDFFLSIQDNGPGIPPQNLARIFDPFFTTKSKGKGTGLGLSISRDIVSRFGGSMEARNLPGGGAEFLLSMPALSREPGVDTTSPTAGSNICSD